VYNYFYHEEHGRYILTDSTMVRWVWDGNRWQAIFEAFGGILLSLSSLLRATHGFHSFCHIIYLSMFRGQVDTSRIMYSPFSPSYDLCTNSKNILYQCWEAFVEELTFPSAKMSIGGSLIFVCAALGQGDLL